MHIDTQNLYASIAVLTHSMAVKMNSYCYRNNTVDVQKDHPGLIKEN